MVLANLMIVIYLVIPIEPFSLSDFSTTVMVSKNHEMAVPFHHLDQGFASSDAVQKSPMDAFRLVYTHEPAKVAPCGRKDLASTPR